MRGVRKLRRRRVLGYKRERRLDIAISGCADRGFRKAASERGLASSARGRRLGRDAAEPDPVRGFEAGASQPWSEINETGDRRHRKTVTWTVSESAPSCG